MSYATLLIRRMTRIQTLLALCCVFAVAWILFAKLIVPPIIESVYRGESFSLLNRAIKGQAEFSVEHYLQKWDRTAMTVFFSGMAFWLLTILTSSQAFFRRFVGEATPGTLGDSRMWTCAILLMSTLWEDLASFALLPLELREPMGLMKIFEELPIGYVQFLGSQGALRAFQWLTELLLFVGAIGWRARIVIPLATIFVFVLNGILREYSGFWHQNLVPIYVLAVLSFTPCGDGWSIDRLQKLYRNRLIPDSKKAYTVYGWARYACWVPIALTYAAAGLSKLRADGLDWVSATNMRHLLYEQTLLPRAGNWSISLHLTAAPDIVFVFLGIAAICGELFFVTVLFSHTARRIFPAVQILMHIGIIFLQNIVFFDLILLLLIFYDFTIVRQKIEQWLSKGGPVEILYDGMCPLCQRTVRVLRSMDFFHRLRLHDFRRTDVSEYSRNYRVSLEDLEKEMFVISRGEAYGGFYGYRIIALAIPALWPLAPWLFVPGISALGKTIYRYVARNRLRLLHCDSSCAVEPAHESHHVAQGAANSNSARHRLSYGITVAALFVAMGSFWVRQIEYYPFTAVPMFLGRKTSVVTYFKTLGHKASGVVSKIYLEDAIGAWSINSRYEPLFSLCFGEPRDIDICKRTLAIAGTTYNKKVTPGEKLTHYEIQKWSWDFDANPNDPIYGKMDDSFIFQIEQNGTDRETPFNHRYSSAE